MNRTRWICSPSEFFSDDDELDGSFGLMTCSDFLIGKCSLIDLNKISYSLTSASFSSSSQKITSSLFSTGWKLLQTKTRKIEEIFQSNGYLVSKTPLSSSDNCVELDALSSCSFDVDNSGILISNWFLRLSPFVVFFFEFDRDLVESVADLFSSRNCICSVHVL